MQNQIPVWNVCRAGFRQSISMAHPLFVLNGPNLNMLGKREPHLYGTTTLAEVKTRTDNLARQLGLDCDFRQTNHEGVMVDWI